MEPPVRVGIDVGGTFTDLIAQGADGEVAVAKVPSTPDNPAIGVMRAIDQFSGEADSRPADIGSVFHGSTVSTNAVIEGTGAKTGLLITEGFGAVPVVGTMGRPDDHALDPFLSEDDVAFLVPSRHVKGVPERVDSEGDVVEPLDEPALRERVGELRSAGVESIAVCFLFSFMNPDHEERTLEVIEEMCPDGFVSLSSRVVPKIREYPRLSTTAIDAYVGPVLSTYLRDLRDRFVDAGLATDQTYLMLSDGGVVPFETAARHPCRTLLSGPAAGVRGAQSLGAALDAADLVTMDMGGTSCDIAVIEDGQVTETKAGTVEGYPLAFPAMEITTIGAGGGTQARVRGSRLRVGPESSGADPGPVCYGRGGTVPTVTDADVLLGRLNPSALLGGAIDVDLDGARRSVAERIAEPLGMAVDRAAAAIVELVDDEMKKEIKVQLSRDGHDARAFSVLAFGGAGPTHAARIADALGIDRVIVPPWPGISSAAGLLATDVQQEYVRSELDGLGTLSAREIDARFDALESEAIADRVSEGFDRGAVATDRRLDLRYEGQGYELTIDVDRLDPSSIRTAFDARHEARYGHRSDEPIEVVTYRVVAGVGMAGLDPPGVGGRWTSDAGDPRTERPVYDIDRATFVDTPIYRRAGLSPGTVIDGPAVIEQLDSTTVVGAGQVATVDPTGSLVLET